MTNRQNNDNQTNKNKKDWKTTIRLQKETRRLKIYKQTTDQKSEWLGDRKIDKQGHRWASLLKIHDDMCRLPILTAKQCSEKIARIKGNQNVRVKSLITWGQ